MDPLTNTGVLQLPIFLGGINLMERYGDLDELFPVCTVDGSEILNRLRCKKKTLKNHEKKLPPNWLDSRRIFGCHQQ